MTGDFDPVGVAEISSRSGLSPQHVAWLLNTDVHPKAPPGTQLARGKVYQWPEIAPYLEAHADRSGPFGGTGRRVRRQPPEPPAAEATEAREWAASGRAGEIRRAAGLTLAAVAAELGVGISTLSRWEHGEDVPRAARAVAYHGLLTRLAAENGG
jgi:DNA-binding XRE family transcriptional regulator